MLGLRLVQNEWKRYQSKLILTTILSTFLRMPIQACAFQRLMKFHKLAIQ